MSRFLDVLKQREPEPVPAPHFVTVYVDHGWAGWRCRCGRDAQYFRDSFEDPLEAAREAAQLHQQETAT